MYTEEYSRVLVCNNPILGKRAGEISVRMFREMGNSYQTELTKESFKEICGREGKWYEVKYGTKMDKI